MIDLRKFLQELGIRVEKTSGGRLWARCPLPDHDDKDPSWSVFDSPSDPRRHGASYCFGCHRWHSPAELVAAIRDVTHAEARAWLRDELDIPVLAVAVEVLPVRVCRSAIIPRGVKWGVPWDDWPTLARRYLSGRRHGLQVVDRWRLGFARDGKLAGRIVLPVAGADGAVVTWQARSYVGAGLRYLTPKQGPVGVLFGAQHWPARDARDVVVVVEGPFDALAVDRACGVPVAALLGSNPSPAQVSAIATFRRVVIATDRDSAGERAAESLAGIRRWVSEIRRVELPEGKDPADIADEELRGVIGVPSNDDR